MTDDKGFYVTRVTAEQVKEFFAVEVSGVPIQSEHLRTSNELVKSLCDYSEGPSSYWLPICRKAADEIERLQRERDEWENLAHGWKRNADDFCCHSVETCPHPRAAVEPCALRDALEAIASPAESKDFGWWTLTARKALGQATPRETEALRAAQPPGVGPCTCCLCKTNLGPHDFQGPFESDEDEPKEVCANCGETRPALTKGDSL